MNVQSCEQFSNLFITILELEWSVLGAGHLLI